MTLNQQLKNLYLQQQNVWETARRNIADLQNIETKTFDFGNFVVKAQCNPARAVSSGAKLDTQSISERKCFLCAGNRPEVQESILYKERYEILVNPYPILPLHFVIAETEHCPQTMTLARFSDMLDLAKDLSNFTILYNGAQAGASAPDHFHFQAVGRGQLPIENDYKILKKIDYLRSCIVIETKNKEFALQSFERGISNSPFLGSLSVVEAWKGGEVFNIFCFYKNDTYIICIFPREKHRPSQYFADGDDFMMISPGAIDMAGILVMPRKQDFEKLTKELITDIFSQVSQEISEPQVSVGIMSEKDISFVVDGNKKTVSFQNEKIFFEGNFYDELIFSPKDKNAVFELQNVTIGKEFHWERKENQRFNGTLKFIVEDEKITAINILSVEDYLKSVISSEMSATASLEFLKAHAVISRSWLLAQPPQPPKGGSLGAVPFSNVVLSSNAVLPNSPLRGAGGLCWYEREAHKNFDVCADDHCQRYQGITRTTTETAIRAVEETRGEVLAADGKICDTRFSKSCGGMSEKFENCWADTPHSYLTNVRDNDNSDFDADLSIEKNAQKWILSSPDAFCNTNDKRILAQVLNNYDQETTDFYRWRVEYSQAEISELIKRKSGIDFGKILDLIPIKRGASGRIVEMKIVGEKRTVIVGKELEIRKWLSESHLYSSAFVVDKEVNNTFVLTGAGWGHGVGLCQIGAAVMAEKGFSYREILAHYYKNTELKKYYL